MRRLLLLLLFGIALLALASSVRADVRETRLPLHEGKLRVHDLNAAVCQTLRLPTCPMGGQINVAGQEGQDFLVAFNGCLWRDSSLTINGSEAIVRLTTTPDGKCEAMRRMARLLTAEESPRATAAQARTWGLLLPQQIDP